MKNDNLLKAASFLVAHLASLSPEYAERLQILKDERNFNDYQAIGSLVCTMLDRGEHLLVPFHPLFIGESSSEPLGPITCSCGNVYTPAYHGQPYCGNRCPALQASKQV